MKTLFFYRAEEFLLYKEAKLSEGFVIHSFSNFFSSAEIDLMDVTVNYIIDLSSCASFIKENESRLCNIEQLLRLFGENSTFIADKKYQDMLLYTLRFIFDKSEDLFVRDIPDQLPDSYIPEDNLKKLIIDLDSSEIESFFSDFEQKLYGHTQFKRDFKEIVKSFCVFNKLGEHKILSLFLMGDSGIGKTEVARCIHKALKSETKMAKINFGNYSSQDALNSLIGSPLGYIGSDGGELMKRVLASDIGLILIDEFEKATAPVFNYFLDVLESGKIVNSQADEYDINGYIIVFTSNISKKGFYERISPELRSRFDYKGLFNLLTDKDKEKFVKFRVSEIIEKYKEKVSSEVQPDLYSKIISEIQVSRYQNMRDLNKKIKDTFVKYVS